MNTSTQIDKKITQTTSLSIISTNPEVDLNTPAWAINWFNTKRRWLYNTYTYFASPLVGKVGGSLWFKAEFVKKLAGEAKDERKMLLIVKYPSAHAFLGLMDFKKFLLLSLLRVKAVDKFVFGFTQKMNIDRPLKDKNAIGSPCLVHHFRGHQTSTENIQSLTTAAAEKGITLAYAGLKSATLQRTIEGKGTADIPFFIDGILVFESTSREVLETFYASNSYQDFTKTVNDSYVAIFKKLG